MKRKQLIALLGSAVIALSSCSSRPVLAEEGSDIGVMAETELMESASEDFPEETPPVTDGADETNEPESPPDMQPEPEEAPPDTEDVPETESIPEAPPEEAPPETEGSTAELPGDGNAQSEESPGTENAETEAPTGETVPATADAPVKESTDAQAVKKVRKGSAKRKRKPKLKKIRRIIPRRTMSTLTDPILAAGADITGMKAGISQRISGSKGSIRSMP